MSTRRGGLAWWHRGVLALVLVGVSISATVPAGAAVVAPPAPPPVAPPVAPPSFSPLPPSLGEGTGTPLWCHVWGTGWLCPDEPTPKPGVTPPTSGEGNPFGSVTVPTGALPDGWVSTIEGWGIRSSGSSLLGGLGGAAGGASPLFGAVAPQVQAKDAVVAVMDIQPSAEWVTLVGIIAPNSTPWTVEGRRVSTGWQARVTYNGSPTSQSMAISSGLGAPTSDLERVAVRWAIGKHDSGGTNDDLSMWINIVGHTVDAVGSVSGTSVQRYEGASRTSWTSTTQGILTFGGGAGAVLAPVGQLIGGWLIPGADNVPVEGSGVVDLLVTAGGPGGSTITEPYDPGLPEVDPNEVPELAPAVPVPWPDGWPDPDLDDPAPSPSTSTIPDPSPRPSLAPEVPGETTDTALASRIMDGFGWLGDRIGGFFDWLVSELWRMVEWIVDRLRELLFQLIVAMLEIARWIVQELFRIIRWAVEELVKALRRIVEVLIDGLSSVIAFLRLILDELVAGFVALANVVGAWATWLGDVIGQWVTWLSTSLWSMFEWLAATLNGIAAWMIEQLETMTLSVSVAFSVLVDLLLDLFVDIFVPSYTWSEVIPDPGPPPPNPLPPGLDDLSAVCGPSFEIPVVELTFRTPNPSTSGCPGHGPGGSRLPVDDLQGDVWGYRNALRALMAFSLWLSVGFVGLRAMPWSRSRDDASDSFVNAAGSL